MCCVRTPCDCAGIVGRPTPAGLRPSVISPHLRPPFLGGHSLRLQSYRPLRRGKPSPRAAIQTRPCRPPSCALPRPEDTRTATVCTSSSSRAEPEAGFSAWSSGVGAASSGSAASRWVSLAEAREKALANRKLAREGGDPLAEEAS